MASFIRKSTGSVGFLPLEIVCMIVDELLLCERSPRTPADERFWTSDFVLVRHFEQDYFQTLRTLRAVSQGFALACPTVDLQNYATMAYCNWQKCSRGPGSFDDPTASLTRLRNWLPYETLHVVDTDKFYSQAPSLFEGAQAAKLLLSMMEICMPALERMVLDLGSTPAREGNRKLIRGNAAAISQYWGYQVLSEPQFKLRQLELIFRGRYFSGSNSPLHYTLNLRNLLSLDLYFDFASPEDDKQRRFHLSCLACSPGLESLRLETAPGRTRVLLAAGGIASLTKLERMRKLQVKNVAIDDKICMEALGSTSDKLAILMLENIDFMEQTGQYHPLLNTISKCLTRRIRTLRIHNVSSILDARDHKEPAPETFHNWCDWPGLPYEPYEQSELLAKQRRSFIIMLHCLGAVLRGLTKWPRVRVGDAYWTDVMERSLLAKVCPGATALAKLARYAPDLVLGTQIDGQAYFANWPENIQG